MIWLTNTHMHTKGKPTIAPFKFQDICKTSFHHKAAYNSMFQEVLQRPCWSRCGGSEWANSLPAPTQPEKRTGAATTGTMWKILFFSKAATPNMGIFLPRQLHNNPHLSTKNLPNAHQNCLSGDSRAAITFLPKSLLHALLKLILWENKVHFLNLVKSRSAVGKVEKTTSSTNSSLRIKLDFYWQGLFHLQDKHKLWQQLGRGTSYDTRVT